MNLSDRSTVLPSTQSNDSTRVRRLSPLLVVLGVVCSIAGCSAPPASVAQAKEEPVKAVAVGRVSRHDLTRSLEVAAEFRPNQEIDLHAKVSGYLKAIHVDIGDLVTKGQLIAELEAPEMTQELAQAEATLNRTQIEVQRALSEVKRSEAQHSIRRLAYERLSAVVKARPNLVAQQELDDAAARERELQAQLASARATLAAAEEQVQIATVTKERIHTMLNYLRITAPFAGMITRRLADPGAMIQAGTASHVQAMPVVRLSQVDHLRLILPVPESAVSRIVIDGPVEVRVDSLRRVVQGRISRFTGKLDSVTRTMETEVDLENPGYALKPGMFGYAKLALDRRFDALSVPVQALSGQTSPATVLVVSPGRRLEQREINVGLETPDLVEVLSGLRENDLVVVGTRANLRPGMVVEPKLQESKTQDAHH